MRCSKIKILIITSVLSLLCILSSTNMQVHAQEAKTEIENDQITQFNELYKQSGVDEIWDSVPDQTKELLEQNGIDSVSPDKLLSLDFMTIFKNLFDMLKDPFKNMSGTLFSLLGVLLIAAIIDALKHSFSSEKYGSVFDVIAVLSTSGVILTSVIGLVKQVTEKLITTNDFILSFIPVYSGIIVASGKPLTGITYNSVLFGAIQIITSICASILVPLICVYLAISVACSVGNVVNLSSLTKNINKFVVWTLGFCMTIFIGLLSMQSLIASSSDNIGLKATKFAMSSLVPVVGGAIGDALSSVYGALGLLKSTVGSFGIITVLLSFLPIIIDLVIMLFIINITIVLADILAVSSVSNICKSISSILGLLLGILLCFIVMTIISISLMILLTNS